MATRLAIFLIRAYQITLSPVLTGSCRFSPTCSHYAAEAISRHGMVRGSWLAFRRLLRCQPFGRPGFDPVPTNEAGGAAKGVAGKQTVSLG